MVIRKDAATVALRLRERLQISNHSLGLQWDWRRVQALVRPSQTVPMGWVLIRPKLVIN